MRFDVKRREFVATGGIGPHAFDAARIHRFLPSPAALGLAFVIQMDTSISMFLGAALAVLASRIALGWTTRFLITTCAGLVAGERIAGVVDAIRLVIAGL